MEDIAEKLQMQQHCQFPTSTKKLASKHQYRNVALSTMEKVAHAWDKDYRSQKERLRAAWAILLRCYTRNDVVSFAELSMSFEGTGPEEQQESIAGGQADVVAWQYDIPDSLRLDNVRPHRRDSCTVENLKGRRVNTVVLFSVPFSMIWDQENGRSLHLRCPGYPEAYNFDLILQVGSSVSDVSMSFNVTAISQQYAHSVAMTLRDILERVTFDGASTVGHLDNSTSEHDKLQMLSWNSPNPFAVRQRFCMHHLVEAKTREIPGAVAVSAWDGTTSYAQLTELADVAALELLRLGVGPGVFVPFAFEKSMWTVVAMLAILKAGGAFVPLNPSDPPARLAEITQNVNAHVIVTMETLVPIFENMVKHVEVISAETVQLGRPDHNTDTIDRPVTCNVTPDDPIFVLFTSGSTGKPKGMIHEHAAICTHAVVHGKAMGYHKARMLQFAAYTFDVAIIDVFTTLIYGGCVCIPSEEDRRNNIIEVINTMKVDYTILTPSFAGLIDPAEVPTLKTVAIGGEALPQDRIERWAKHVRFIQIYGPAEVGICIMMDMKPNTPPETLGYPLLNSSCWLVDPDNSDILVPIGAVGELVVAGPSLARGYLNDETRTQSSFISTPVWATRLGILYGRCYKTGDLLRYNVDSFDGSFDFVGRKDAQIKLRGQRLEPGEIEYHLGLLPGVAVSMVTRPEKGAYAGELVAVVQMQRVNGERSRVQNQAIGLAAIQSLSIDTVHSLLAKVLPSYMIPSICLVVNSMPFVPSLKIDRRAVNDWLAKMEAMPFESPISTLSRLESHETTASALSVKVVELVTGGGRGHGRVLAGHDFALQEAGIDSIKIISLSMFLSQNYSTKIPLNVLLSSKVTIRELAKLADHHNEEALSNGHTLLRPFSIQSLDIRAEIDFLSKELFRNIEAQRSGEEVAASPKPIRNVFVTGATGYLGSAIIQQLLAQPSLQIHALVRCKNPSEGLQRIITAATANGWWHDDYISRLHIWQGDLTVPCLGLNDCNLNLLQGTSNTIPKDLCIHAIIHNGARVHYNSDYHTLKPVNTLSTLHLLTTTAISPHLQTFLFVSGGENPNIDHPPIHNPPSSSPPPPPRQQQPKPLTHPLTHSNGYTQTKHISESLVRHCATHPLFRTKTLYTVKPGYIIGSASHGIANRADFIWRLVAGCVEIGAYNREEENHWLYLASVDRVAASVIDLILPNSPSQNDRRLPLPPSGHVERVLDGIRFVELWRMLEQGIYRAQGFHFEALRGDVWMRRLRDWVVGSGERHMLFPLLHTLEQDGGCIGDEKFDGEQGGMLEKSAGVREAVKRNLEYLVEVGFLPEVPGSGRVGVV
ncbi:MAG: hypothetical protein Q9166_006943 [cf. Caloplaca sp. 2 TL-2023]